MGQVSKHNLFKARMIRDQIDKLEHDIQLRKEWVAENEKALEKLREDLKAVDEKDLTASEELLIKLVKCGCKRILIMATDDGFTKVVIYADKFKPLTMAADQVPELRKRGGGNWFLRTVAPMLETNRAWKKTWQTATLESLKHPSRVLAQTESNN
jgi:hypothetical protein